MKCQRLQLASERGKEHCTIVVTLPILITKIDVRFLVCHNKQVAVPITSQYKFCCRQCSHSVLSTPQLLVSCHFECSCVFFSTKCEQWQFLFYTHCVLYATLLFSLYFTLALSSIHHHCQYSRSLLHVAYVVCSSILAIVALRFLVLKRRREMMVKTPS